MSKIRCAICSSLKDETKYGENELKRRKVNPNAKLNCKICNRDKQIHFCNRKNLTVVQDKNYYELTTNSHK